MFLHLKEVNTLKNVEKLRIEEVAIFIGTSVNTINSWYRFKKQYPDDEYAKMIPDFERGGGERGIRYWNQESIEQLIDFKNKRPKGRKGVMGAVTQKYVKKEKKHGKENCITDT